MAATLSNRAFFVNSEPHVSKGSFSVCHSSCPLSLKLKTPLKKSLWAICLILILSHFSLGWLQFPWFTWLYWNNKLATSEKTSMCPCRPHEQSGELLIFSFILKHELQGACSHTQRIFSIDILQTYDNPSCNFNSESVQSSSQDFLFPVLWWASVSVIFHIKYASAIQLHEILPMVKFVICNAQ